ncbi:hypothetical protein Agau_L200078 [Agrobacterium tumefaciens F2]|nr:hypothetical protein Agau_L200078 [Agrobacterium tumefaciens F2]
MWICLLIKGDHLIGTFVAVSRPPPYATKPGFSRHCAETARCRAKTGQRRRHQKSTSIDSLHLLLPRFANFSLIT